eukprot:m.527180 g.527180  ORF g.527180 m.527180 type:complete len:55 (+) comp22009_c1_seq13:704-868(+)
MPTVGWLTVRFLHCDPTILVLHTRVFEIEWYRMEKRCHENTVFLFAVLRDISFN